MGRLFDWSDFSYMKIRDILGLKAWIKKTLEKDPDDKTGTWLIRLEPSVKLEENRIDWTMSIGAPRHHNATKDTKEYDDLDQTISNMYPEDCFVKEIAQFLEPFDELVYDPQMLHTGSIYKHLPSKNKNEPSNPMAWRMKSDGKTLKIFEVCLIQGVEIEVKKEVLVE